jgi:plastocyanin domain-containing protein
MRHLFAALFLAAAAAAPALATPAASDASDTGDANARPAARRVEIQVTEKGFEPREVKVKRGEAVTLVFTRLTDRTCITAIDLPAENVKELELPLHQPVSLTITPKKKGVEKFHCSAMAMGDGRIVVE